MICTRPKRRKPCKTFLIFAGRQPVGARASTGVAITMHTAAQIIRNMLSPVDYLAFLWIKCRAGSKPRKPAQPALRARRKARAIIRRLAAMNQDIKMLCDLMIKNCDHSLDRIKAQIEQLTRMIGDYRAQVECLRAENRALKRLLEQEHGLDKKRIQRIVAVLQQRNFQVIQGGKSCTNTEQQLDG